jgi:hypothetical protein
VEKRTNHKRTEDADAQVETRIERTAEQPSECFVIMPISDQDGYPEGHFTKVYNQIVKPSIEAAGYKSIRVDETENTHLIHATIIKKLIEAPMAICDLSSKNPNVMFELGIRQAFNMPVVLIQDEKTHRIFDVGGLNTLPYNSSREYDCVIDIQKRLKDAIISNGLNSQSLISLVNILPAKKELDKPSSVNNKIDLMLNIISQLNSRINIIDNNYNQSYISNNNSERLTNILSSAKDRTYKIIKYLDMKKEINYKLLRESVFKEIEEGLDECRVLEQLLQNALFEYSELESESISIRLGGSRGLRTK